MVNKEKTELGNFKSYKEVLDFVPRSVWECNSRNKEIKEIFEDDLEKHTCKRTNEGYAVKIKQKFSVFNPTLGMNILKIWSNDNDIVLDPFSGRDRALICNYYNRNYIGYEISNKTYLGLIEKISKWKYINNNYNIKIYNDDGINLKHTHDGSVDFIFSCPPYWDKEKYETCDGQISDISTREQWSSTIKQCANNCFNKLKNGKYAAFILADIRRKGRLVSLHTDWINAFEAAGFFLKDIVINKTNPMNCSGINGFLRNKIMWKTHEYILVFKKD